MDVKEIRKGEATVVLSSSEFAFLCVAVGETLEQFTEANFHTRTGFTIPKAEALLEFLGELYDKSKAG
jgi:hypothetical protein